MYDLDIVQKCMCVWSSACNNKKRENTLRDVILKF